MGPTKLVLAGALSSALVVAGAPAVAARRSPTNVARRVGIAEITRTWTANVSDYDNDGDQDWLLVRHNPQWLWFGTGSPPTATLYRNTGKRFVAAATGFGHSDKHDCDFGDADRDGDRDLFCAVGLDSSSTNELWRKRTSGWSNASRRFGLREIESFGDYRTATFLYANGDAYPDVYVARYPGPNGPPLNEPAESPPRPNQLYINVKGERFRNAPRRGLNRGIGAQKDTPGCVQAVDFNRDGRQDLMVCGYKGLHLYRRGNGTRFRDLTRRYDVGGPWKDARLARLDRDDRRDLVRVREDLVKISYFKRRRWRGRFRRALTGGEGVATGDFNGDGRGDVYVLRTCVSGRDRSDLVLLNAGHGDFRVRRIPGVARGCGNDVEAIDFDDDRRDDFLVLNGKRRSEGPVQLFTFR